MYPLFEDDLQTGIFQFGLERCLRTLFPTSCTFLVGKGRKRYTTLRALRTLFPTSCTFLVGKGGRGTQPYEHFVLFSQHLVHFLLEKGGREHCSTNTREEKLANEDFLDWNGAFVLFSQHLVHFLLEEGGATQLYKHFEKARKEQAKRGSFWIGTAPLYYFSNIFYVSSWERREVPGNTTKHWETPQNTRILP